MADYLRDELLAPLSAADRRFLLCASVLDELSGPACDAVLGRDDSAIVLARLVRRRLLIPLQPSDDRCRWPGLLRDMLRAELRRCEPVLAPRLHRRASDWCADGGDLDRADRPRRGRGGRGADR